MTNLTDEQLMQQVTLGDQDALAILYDRHAGLLLGVVRRILGDTKLSEDVVQETFWRVWDKADTFDLNKGKFTTWMFSIGRRRAIDVYRRQKVRPSAAPDERALLRMNSQASDVDVAETVSKKLIGDSIRKALDDLSSEQRTVIELAYFQGKTRSQISKETGIPLGTVHTRVRLALKYLSSILHEHRGVNN